MTGLRRPAANTPMYRAARPSATAPEDQFAAQSITVQVERGPRPPARRPVGGPARPPPAGRPGVRETCPPTPGTVRNRSSFSRHTGLLRRIRLRPSSRSSNSCSNQAMWASMRGWTALMAVPRRVLLRDRHGHHLAPTSNQRVEYLGLGVLQRAHRGTNGGDEAREDRAESRFLWQSHQSGGG